MRHYGLELVGSESRCGRARTPHTTPWKVFVVMSAPHGCTVARPDFHFPCARSSLQGMDVPGVLSMALVEAKQLLNVQTFMVDVVGWVVSRLSFRRCICAWVNLAFAVTQVKSLEILEPWTLQSPRLIRLVMKLMNQQESKAVVDAGGWQPNRT